MLFRVLRLYADIHRMPVRIVCVVLIRSTQFEIIKGIEKGGQLLVPIIALLNKYEFSINSISE